MTRTAASPPLVGYFGYGSLVNAATLTESTTPTD